MSDHTAIVQGYIDSCRDTSGYPPPPLARGRYEIHDTLRVSTSMGCALRGSGGHSRSSKVGWDPFRACTTLAWKGPPGKPFMVLEGCTGFYMGGLNFEGADTGLLVTHGRSGSLNLTFEQCSWIGQTVGMQLGTAWGESTCANIVTRDCYWEGQASAYLSVNQQSVEHLLIRPKFAFAKRCIDIQGGGGVTVLAGGPYQCKSFLHVGRIGGNARGFSVRDVRFDGKGLRQAWLTVDDTDRPQAYGTITYANCRQNDGQQGDVSQPLVTVPPGCRVVMRDCSFNGSLENWAKVYSTGNVPGELVIRDCDGIGVEDFGKIIQAKGDRAFYKWDTCGSLWGLSGSFSTFPVGP